jgi:hypothetical protein
VTSDGLPRLRPLAPPAGARWLSRWLPSASQSTHLRSAAHCPGGFGKWVLDSRIRSNLLQFATMSRTRRPNKRHARITPNAKLAAPEIRMILPISGTVELTNL